MEKEEFPAMLEGVMSGIDSGERLLVCGDLCPYSPLPIEKVQSEFDRQIPRSDDKAQFA